MELYRVFVYQKTARTGEPGHPLYIYPQQGAGRWDNPNHYRAWYFSLSAAGAVGETFGNLAKWSEPMFTAPYLLGGRRALAVFELPDDAALQNLDDAETLSGLSVKPSQVVARNNAFTQPLALSIFDNQNRSGNRMYAGLTWWSFHRPYWTNAVLWQADGEPVPIKLERVEPLSLESTAITDAAASLNKLIE